MTIGRYVWWMQSGIGLFYNRPWHQWRLIRIFHGIRQPDGGYRLGCTWVVRLGPIDAQIVRDTGPVFNGWDIPSPRVWRLV